RGRLVGFVDQDDPVAVHELGPVEVVCDRERNLHGFPLHRATGVVNHRSAGAGVRGRQSSRRPGGGDVSVTNDWMAGPTGKVCLVTGGAGGIGRALAARFLAAGMRVVVADVEPDALRGAVDALGAGDRVLGVTYDVRSLDDTQRLRDEILARFGS